MLRFLMTLAFAAISAPALAQISEPEIDALVKQGQDSQDMSEIEELVRAAQERRQRAAKDAQQIIDGSYSVRDAVKSEYDIDLDGPAPVRGEDTLYVFISFSMPDAMIRQYLQDALRYKGRVVIRGLIEGSMAKTMGKLATLIERDEERSIGAAIDPHAFEAFGIETVPAIALSEYPLKRCEKEDCTMEVGKFDVIYGSVSLKYALEQFEGRGDVRKVARAQLLQGR